MAAETNGPFEVDRGIGAAALAVLVALARVVGSATAGAGSFAGEDRLHKGMCRSRESSWQKLPGDCCEWYSGWGKMQVQGQELMLVREPGLERERGREWAWGPELGLGLGLGRPQELPSVQV